MEKPAYHPFYCEENVWHLCSQFGKDGRRGWAVLVSNADRKVPTAWMRAAEPGEIVIWDYHAFAIEAGKRPLVWDLDCTLGHPIPLLEYLDACFIDAFPKPFQPLFRIMTANDYVRDFASDRRHMRNKDGTWKQPPPAWPPINANRGSNLGEWLDFSLPLPGDVVDRTGLINLCV